MKKIIRHPSQFLNICAFKHLWEISFAYCDFIPSTLETLTNFACLGFVDISFTPINLKQIQLVFSKMNVIHFNCIECPNIIDCEVNFSIRRGFLIEILPYIWNLNEMYITHNERQEWKNYFASPEGYSTSIWSKWHIVQTNFFTTNDDIIWTENAKEWLSYPVYQMGINLDLWKIEKMMRQLDKDSSIACIELFFDNPFALLLLITASFFPVYPKFVLHDVLKLLFPAWSNFDEGPLNTSVKQRILFCGILCAHLKIQASSVTSHSVHNFFDYGWTSSFFPKLIDTIVASLYPRKAVDLEFKGYRAESYENAQEMEYLVDSILNKKELKILSRLHLLISELICATTHDRLFLSQANELKKNILLHGDHIIGDLVHSYNDSQDWEIIPEGMSISSRAAEIKIKMIMLVWTILEQKPKMEDKDSVYVIRPNFKQK